MFRKMFAALALLCASTAFAASTTIDTTGLSDAQIAELKAHAAQAVAAQAKGEAAQTAPTKDVGTAVTLAATWGQQAAAAAEGFAKAMGIAARELNVTINDFLKSDAGKLTALVIIWKVAGAAILKALYGTVFLTFGILLVRTIYLRLFTAGYEKVEYSRFGGFFKGTKLVRIPKTISQLENDGEWLTLWVLLAICIALAISGAAFF
jgi:hypothetical protein